MAFPTDLNVNDTYVINGVTHVVTAVRSPGVYNFAPVAGLVASQNDVDSKVAQAAYDAKMTALDDADQANAQAVVDRIPKTKVVEFFADCLAGNFTGFDRIETKAHHSHSIGGEANYVRSGNSGTPSSGGEGVFYDATGDEWILTGIVTPEIFGDDSSVSDVSSINSAIDFARNNNRRLSISAMSNVDDTVDLTELFYGKIDFKTGAGFNRTNLTGPVVKLSGNNLSFSGELYAKYDDQLTITTSDTSAVGILLGGVLHSTIEALRSEHVCHGIRHEQAGGWPWPFLVSGDFSNTISRIQIRDFVGEALRLEPYGTGNTGSVINNIYVNNMDYVADPNGIPRDCQGAVYISSATEMIINQLNIEHCNPTIYTTFFHGDAITVNGLHYEGVTPKHDYSALVSVGANTYALINSMVCIYCTFDETNVTYYSAVATQAGSKVKINGFAARDNTVIGTVYLYKTAYLSATGDNSVRVDMAIVKNDVFSLPDFSRKAGQYPIFVDSLARTEISDSAGGDESAKINEILTVLRNRGLLGSV